MPGPHYPSAPADSEVKGRMDRDPFHALTSGEYHMLMKQETPFWGPVGFHRSKHSGLAHHPTFWPGLLVTPWLS